MFARPAGKFKFGFVQLAPSEQKPKLGLGNYKLGQTRIQTLLCVKNDGITVFCWQKALISKYQLGIETSRVLKIKINTTALPSHNQDRCPSEGGLQYQGHCPSKGGGGQYQDKRRTFEYGYSRLLPHGRPFSKSRPPVERVSRKSRCIHPSTHLICNYMKIPAGQKEEGDGIQQLGLENNQMM